MKKQSDLVRGWLRKAESDRIAMRASAEQSVSRGSEQRHPAETQPSKKLIGRAAEVAFWKNFGEFRGRDRIARDLLEWLSHKDLSWQAFRKLTGACGQPSGFATPLAFLGFYDPERFPMVDGISLLGAVLPATGGSTVASG